jgi:hypothetical protein
MAGGFIDLSKVEVTSPLETYRGVEISQVSAPITSPQGAPPQAKEALEQVYGEQFAYQYAASGNTMIMTLGSRANELIKKAIDGLKDGATGIGPSPAYQSATAGLPKSRSLTGFLSLVRLTQAVMSMAAPMEGEAGQPEPLEGVTPSGVGLALSFEAGQVTLDIYVPQAELANLGVVLQQVVAALAGPPPFAPVEPGAPQPGPPVPVPPAQ